MIQSWLDFATFGRSYPGGWAKDEGLYCVDTGTAMSDIQTDIFQYRFLKHEAQHFSDFKRFPHMKEWELEYRAKLIELVYYPQTHELLSSFLFQAKEDEKLSHPYAAYQIISHLSKQIFKADYIQDQEKWLQVDPTLLKTTAQNLFTQDIPSFYPCGYNLSIYFR